MPLVIRKQDVIATINMLRMVREQAADAPTSIEAERLLELWEAQLRPGSPLTTESLYP